MNMTTSLDNIPMKTNIGVKTDDSDDPVVKDILNEFQQELKINNGYEINYDSSAVVPPVQPQTPVAPVPQVQQYQRPTNQQLMMKTNTNKSFYNEEYARKAAIIIIIIGIIFSPIIYNSIIERIPNSFMGLFISYDFYIKSLLAFIAIYLLYNYKLI
jgi:hypothetical protein